jgi:hypothetical protein
MTNELLDKLRKGKQFTVTYATLQGKTLKIPIKLAGFSKAQDGPPADIAKYREAQRKAIEAIGQRQIEAQAKESQAPSVGEGPSPSQPQPVYPDGSSSAAVEENQAAVTDTDNTVEAFCEAAAVSAKSVGAEKDAFMSWCRSDAAKLLPSPAP